MTLFALLIIAKKIGEPRIIIQNWMRTRNSIEFLGTWEVMHNPEFKRIEFDAFLFEAGGNSFSMSPSKWISTTNAKGIFSRAGRNGGTYAHRDLALGFCYWISPPFQLYIIKEFQRLKRLETQANKEALEWNLNRVLTKINYRIHTDAIKEVLIPKRITTKGIVYANEADILNVALFGKTAKMWRTENPTLKGNIRDYATTEQLLVLANLEAINAELISAGLREEARFNRLNEAAINQMQSLLSSPSIKQLPKQQQGKP